MGWKPLISKRRSSRRLFTREYQPRTLVSTLLRRNSTSTTPPPFKVLSQNSQFRVEPSVARSRTRGSDGTLEPPSSALWKAYEPICYSEQATQERRLAG